MADTIERELGILSAQIQNLCERLDEHRNEQKERFRKLETLLESHCLKADLAHADFARRLAALEYWRSAIIWGLGIIIASLGTVAAWMKGK